MSLASDDSTEVGEEVCQIAIPEALSSQPERIKHLNNCYCSLLGSIK